MMEVPISQLPPGDTRLVDAIVNQLKSKGIFDKFRKECLADVDTKPAFQNLRQRVDGHVKKFLGTKAWKSDMNKNQIRDGVRKDIQESGILDAGIDAIINQVVTPKITPLILPYVEDTVYTYLQVEKPNRELEDEHRYGENQVNAHHMDYNQSSMPYSGLPPHLQKNVYADPQDVLTPTINTEPVNIQKEEKKQMSNNEVIPMATDVISSEEDETLLYTNEKEATSTSDSTQQYENLSDVKMQVENAVDSFDSARRDCEIVTAGVEKLSFKGSDSCSSVSKSDGVDQNASNTIFDRQSLDSISSNSSNLSFSPQSSRQKAPSCKTDTEESMKDAMSVDDLRSSQSTPLEDEKSVSSQTSTEHGEWSGSALPKSLPSAERITIASFGQFESGANRAMVVSGAGPVGAESQNSLDTSTTKDSSEGALNVNSPDSLSLQQLGLDEVSSSTSGSPSIHSAHREADTNSEKGHSSKSTSTDDKSRKSNHRDSRHRRDRHRHSKSKDDHSSHRKKDSYRKDRDDDSDKDRNSKGHYHTSSSSHHSSSHHRREKGSTRSSSHKSDKHGHSYKSDHHRSRSHFHKPKKLLTLNEDINLMGNLNKNKTVNKHQLSSPEPNNNNKLNIEKHSNMERSEHKNGKKLIQNKGQGRTSDRNLNTIEEENNSRKMQFKSGNTNMGNKETKIIKNGLTTSSSSHHTREKCSSHSSSIKSDRHGHRDKSDHHSSHSLIQKPKKLLTLNEDITLMGNLNKKNTPTKRKLSPETNNNTKLNMEQNDEMHRSEYKNGRKLKENKNESVTTKRHINVTEEESMSGKTNDRNQGLKVIKNGLTTLTQKNSLRVSIDDLSTSLEASRGKRKKIEKPAILPPTNSQRLVICSFNADAKVLEPTLLDDSDDGSDFEGFEPTPKRINLDYSDMFSEPDSAFLFDFEGFPDSSFPSSSRIRNYLARMNYTGHCSRHND